MWCLLCASFATSKCNNDEDHSCIDMSTVFFKNIEALLTLRNDLYKKVEESISKLTQAIDKRREVKDYLKQVSKALKLLTTETECLKEESDLLLIELNSHLQRSIQDVEAAEKDLCLSELISVIDDDCSGEETIEIPRDKLGLIARIGIYYALGASQYKDVFIPATNRFKEFEERMKTKITVRLFDEANNPFMVFDNFKKGFTVNCQLEIPHLLLISHVIFAINKTVENSPTPSTSSQQKLTANVCKEHNKS